MRRGEEFLGFGLDAVAADAFVEGEAEGDVGGYEDEIGAEGGEWFRGQCGLVGWWVVWCGGEEERMGVAVGWGAKSERGDGEER